MILTNIMKIMICNDDDDGEEEEDYDDEEDDGDKYKIMRINCKIVLYNYGVHKSLCY